LELERRYSIAKLISILLQRCCILTQISYVGLHPEQTWRYKWSGIRWRKLVCKPARLIRRSCHYAES